PVNVARESRGELAVTAVWLWGGGRLADLGPLPRLAVTAPETVPGDVVRGVALHEEKRTARPTTPTDNASRDLVDVVEQAQHDDRAAVAVISDKNPDIDTRCFAPALELLVARKLESVTIVGNGVSGAVVWKAKPPTLWQRLTQRRASPLRIPTADDR
ncbi:MAG TPA: hypothetical protein VJ891_18540, partial [Casimicrobiaceae bacterium]|nr:hypothetical protein [Casimicrobiaceae bacterium]